MTSSAMLRKGSSQRSGEEMGTAIASELFLSVKTVETYRARLSDKLGLRTRAEIFRFALQEGLLAEPEPGTPTASR